eukprot:TRINITY_DN55711_c0_g1_i1.p1 TRINITY_DN55711_c0_g1~~TRINITY_DN55711_c0_g1_i1.p1  ORF type:complete len:273 (-),score=80.12 TRINITY_DN55711_c0_g1_i1:58-795(-)
MALTDQLVDKFNKAANDQETKVLIYTATDPYFCSGGSLAEFLGKKSPKGLQKMIRENNERCFNIFIEFPKPIIAAVNGPGIGSGTTAPALCDIIIASPKATFLTPFKNLGVGPEGCASVHFERILGSESAKRLLIDCWKPTAAEAKEIGLVAEVVPHKELLVRAQELGEEWARSGRGRIIRGGGDVEEYKKINARESNDLAEAFVSEEFLRTQLQFLRKKGKHLSIPGAVLWLMLVTRPAWAKLL